MRKIVNLIKPVRGIDVKNPLLQIFEIFNYSVRLVLTPNEYRLYRMYDKNRGVKEALSYLSGFNFIDEFHKWNGAADISLLSDKMKFHKYFGSHDLPTPELFGVYVEKLDSKDIPKTTQVVKSPEGFAQFLSELGENSIVVKPVNGIQGYGVRVIRDTRKTENGSLEVLTGGKWVTATDFAAEFDPDDQYLIERRMVQHPEIARINPHTINTLRIVTFLHNDGKVDIEYALLRCGRKDIDLDNWEQGGVAVPIAKDEYGCFTGKLAAEGQTKPKYNNDPFTSHPDTGVVFDGLEIPNWELIVKASEDFARASGIRTVGWDVIVGEDGPIFIEGNHDWDPQLVQFCAEGLFNFEFRKKIYAECGLKYPSRKLPPVSIARWKAYRRSSKLR